MAFYQRFGSWWSRLVSLYDSTNDTMVPWRGTANGAAYVLEAITDAADVTPHDDTEVTCRALWVGTGGTVVVKFTATGSAVSFIGVPSGYHLPVVLTAGRVMAATNADNIRALN
jgi:hypothetical protein